MSRSASARLTWFIAGFGVLAVVFMQLSYGTDAGISAAVGAAVALGNWLMLRLIVDRVVGGTVRKQVGLSFLLIVKMGALVALSFLLLRSGWVQVLPFTAGVSSLMAGALTGSFVHVLTAKPVESER
jgi:hypothetical protein